MQDLLGYNVIKNSIAFAHDAATHLARHPSLSILKNHPVLSIAFSTAASTAASLVICLPERTVRMFTAIFLPPRVVDGLSMEFLRMTNAATPSLGSLAVTALVGSAVAHIFFKSVDFPFETVTDKARKHPYLTVLTSIIGSAAITTNNLHSETLFYLLASCTVQYYLWESTCADKKDLVERVERLNSFRDTIKHYISALPEEEQKESIIFYSDQYREWVTPHSPNLVPRGLLGSALIHSIEELKACERWLEICLLDMNKRVSNLT